MTVDTVIVYAFHVFAYVLGGLASLWLVLSLALKMAGRIAERLWTFEALSRAAMMCAHKTWLKPPGSVPGGTREAIARAPLPGCTPEEVDNGGAMFDGTSRAAASHSWTYDDGWWTCSDCGESAAADSEDEERIGMCQRSVASSTRDG